MPSIISHISITLNIALGGGIALITGAQTNVPALGLSAPNARLSRLTFQPKISVESLNFNTFNIVPDRDMVPKFDDLAMNYQRIQCRGNSTAQCHYKDLSICELLYTCGSRGRPIPCVCMDYGFPLPKQSGVESYESQCSKN